MGAAIEGAVSNVQIELIPGGRGDFIVTADGHELWNKRQMGDEFPAESRIVTEVRERAAG